MHPPHNISASLLLRLTMMKNDHFQNFLVQMIIFSLALGSLKQLGKGGKTGVCRGTSPCPFLNGNNTDYKQGAKKVQDIREGSQDRVCKVQLYMLCHRVKPSGTLLVLQNTKSIVSIGCR